MLPEAPTALPSLLVTPLRIINNRKGSYDTYIDVGVWGLLVRLAVLVEHASLDHGFLERSFWSETPLFGVDVSFHDNSLDLGNDARLK